MISQTKIAVVIPAFRVSNTLHTVVKNLPKEVDYIVVVDDACPEKSGYKLTRAVEDNRLTVLHREANGGVGAATKTGLDYIFSSTDAEISVKLDGDNQMDPALLVPMVRTLQSESGDFIKGNRFDRPAYLRSMPVIRLIGNGILSLYSKFSSGYWHVNDPTNGYVAITKEIYSSISTRKLDNGFFFESDLLGKLALEDARVIDFPIPSRYGAERSNLGVTKAALTFPAKYTRNFFYRFLYQYLLRGWSPGSLEFPLGLGLFVSGCLAGLTSWIESASTGIPATAGTVMLSVLPIIIGFQLLLEFLSGDIEKSRNKTTN